MPVAWRIVKTRYAETAFDGEGAWLDGGRWNSPGVRVVYASQSVSLAALEVMVGLRRASMLASYSTISIRFDEADVETLASDELPSDWRRYPAPAELQRIGDIWASQQRSLVLRVPSVVVSGESNFLVNPSHRAFSPDAIATPVPFEFDSRLAGVLRRR